MKRSSIWKAALGAVCLGGLCAACTTRPEIHITGSVRHADGALLVYQRSVGGMFNSQTMDTLKLQADSTFTLTLPGGEYERVQFYLYGKKKMGSLLAKEGTMRIELDGWAEKPMTITEGQDDKTVRVAELLDQLYEDVFAIRARRGDRWQIARDTVATSVRRKLTDYALSLDKEVEGVDEDLRTKVRQDIRMQLLLAFYDFTHRLTGKAQEAALAQLFLEDESQQRYDPQLLPLADEFRRLYPESGWMSWVDRAVAKNRAFNETTIPADIHFPDVSSAKTIKDVIDRYKGKVIFMDIWATWCGPCRASFAHVGPLQEYAAANDVVLLYLSIDRPEDDEKWRKMAAHYNLKGEHVRGQEAFHQEIYDTFGHKGALSIPRCVIFDKQGNIRFSTAASPGQWDKLKEQLQEAAR